MTCAHRKKQTRHNPRHPKSFGFNHGFRFVRPNKQKLLEWRHRA